MVGYDRRVLVGSIRTSHAGIWSQNTYYTVKNELRRVAFASTCSHCSPLGAVIASNCTATFVIPPLTDATALRVFVTDTAATGATLPNAVDHLPNVVRSFVSLIVCSQIVDYRCRQ